jgi:hypothetical protein
VPTLRDMLCAQVAYEQDAWQSAMARARGERVLDDPKLLSRCVALFLAWTALSQGLPGHTLLPVQVTEEGGEGAAEKGRSLEGAARPAAQGAGRQAEEVRLSLLLHGGQTHGRCVLPDCAQHAYAGGRTT